MKDKGRLIFFLCCIVLVVGIVAFLVAPAFIPKTDKTHQEREELNVANLISEINIAREAHGLQPVYENAALDELAVKNASTLAFTNQGRFQEDQNAVKAFLTEKGYRPSGFGELYGIGPEVGGALQLVEYWQGLGTGDQYTNFGDPLFTRILIYPTYTDVGVGIVQGPGTTKYVFVTMASQAK